MRSAETDGFTLLEVIVALLVASLLLTVLLRADLTARERIAINDQREQAVMLARRLVADARSGPFEAGERKGSEDGLQWQIAENALLVDP